MGQKVHPIGQRLGYIKGWESNWISSKKDLPQKLKEDDDIRKYLEARMAKGGISCIGIERTLKKITITIHTARPGMIIGKGGAEVDKVREEIRQLTGKDVHINIVEIKRPELDAKLVGQSIAQQLRGRVSYRRAMKQAIAAAMRVGAQGIKIQVSGRLGGAEIARSEQYKEGRVPLHTLRADIDYASVGANTIYGTLGVKVWIFKGEIYGRPDLSPNAALDNKPAASRANRGGIQRRKKAS